MKKKIKDLTLKECQDICLKYYDCDKCPLCRFHPQDDEILDCPHYDDEYLDKEVFL